ncbi:hypothetical protein OA88_21395 [Flavobacterium sp. JRM]|nr:hypothetical protein OA88_21395 [Flavobacterium sp. JRM]
MERPAVLFTSVLNLAIEIDSFEIEEGLYISINKKQKLYILENSYSAIGGLEFKSVIDNPVFAFAYISKKITDENKKEILRDFLFHLDTFIQALWIVKDNSIYKEIGYLKYRNDEMFFSNFIAQINSNCFGKKVVSIYDYDEVLLAKKYYHKLKKYASNGSDFEYSNLTSDSNRISRYLYYLNGARMLPDIGFKYALYCTALESLLATKCNNITKQLANRVDYILSKEALNVKSCVYKAYDYRSQIFHGNTFKDNDIKKKEKLLNNLQILDEICRLVFQEIFNNEEYEQVLLLDNEKIDTYFLEESY